MIPLDHKSKAVDALFAWGALWLVVTAALLYRLGFTLGSTMGLPHFGGVVAATLILPFLRLGVRARRIVSAAHDHEFIAEARRRAAERAIEERDMRLERELWQLSRKLKSGE